MKVIRNREWKTKIKKYSIEHIKTTLEAEGYVLLEEVYVNNRTPMKVLCPKGHERMMRFDNWMAGHRCKVCNTNVVPPKKEVNIRHINKDIAENGYKIIEGYVNSNTKLMLECPNGHIYNVLWSTWKRGDRCTQCSKVDRFMQRIGQCKQ